MRRACSTEQAQVGLFPVGNVLSPLTPAVNATTFIAQSLRDLSPVDATSLTAGGSDLFAGLYYGGVDTPTTRQLAARMARLENGTFAVLAPSGQSAIHLTLTALVKPGDHVLVCDSTTYTTLWLLENHVSALGVEVEYFAPAQAASLSTLLRPNTRVVFWESPGAFTFELVDIRALVEACVGHPAVTVMDNTWAASTFFHPLEIGVDVAVLSLTKSHAGAAGVSLGVAVTRDQAIYRTVKVLAALLGVNVGSEACAAALQSISTLGARLSRQMATTTQLLRALSSMRGIRRVFHPLVAADRSLFDRHFNGFNSLVSVEAGSPSDELGDRLARLRVIKAGYGWGGTVSLVNLFDPSEWASAARQQIKGACARFYFGLEDADELENDLRLCLDH